MRNIHFYLLILVSFCFFEANAQCEQQFDWAVWSDFTGDSALGTITQGGQTISVEVNANYNFNSTSGIFNYGAFNGFSSVVPNTTVPRTTWAAGVGGETTMCFSEVVSNPVLLLSSLGSWSSQVTLELSLPYQVIYDGGGMTYLSDTAIFGAEGYAIIVFPGDFDCVTIYSSTPENYTNLTWGLNPPLFPVTLNGDLLECDSTTIVASGGSSYEWSGGLYPDASSNTFVETGSYFLTVTDDIGCEVVTSVDIQLDTLCTDCLGNIGGTAVIDDCGECLEPTDPLFNASCTDCLGAVNGTAVLDDCGECLEPMDPLFNASCTDCLGVVNGTAVLDDCGECLEPTDPLFNASCTDCLGVVNGTAVLDDCGECLEPTDPLFNASCTDCLGIVNGTAVLDDCGECLEPTDPLFNASCTDCLGVVNGTAVLDDCGECLEPTDPLFNASCTDCFNVVNGTAVLDDCGECLEPTDPLFNASCTDCLNVVNGTAVIDDCGECLEPTNPLFSASCADCLGVINGTAVLDDCGECLEPTDLNFNLTCISDFDFYIPNVFSPNNDGINDMFQVYNNLELEIQVNEFSIFDRWGSLIYQIKNQTFQNGAFGWDGRIGDQEVEMGVYLYLIELEFINGAQKVFAGNVTLVR
jgi:gliding motility-associated-like protein